MTPQELKLSVIHLAMLGKLVNQSPEDEPAQILLSKITAEKKQKGIKSNSKVLPILDEDIPFDIPETWCWTRFGDIVTYNMGKTPPRAESQWWENDFPWVAIADMPESGHIIRTKERVSLSAVLEKFGNKVSKAGTMIMSFKLTVGRVSILDIDAVHNEAIISIYPLCDKDRIIQKYLFSILPTITQFGDSKNAIKGKTLNDTSISNLLIPFPPLAEQKRIVAKIEELLPLIERYEKAWSRLEDFNKRFPGDMQKSILQMAIQGKLVEQRPEEGTGEELYHKIQAEKQALIKAGRIKKEKPLPKITEDAIPFEIPESWKWVRLKDLSLTIVDCPHSTPQYYDYDTGYYAIGTKCLTAEGEISRLFNIDKETYQHRIERLKPIENDIVYSREGSIICRAVLLPADKKICLGQRVMLIRCPNGVLPKYIQKYLMSDQTIAILTQNYKGVGVKHINVAEVCALPIPLPPIAEQKRIVAKLGELLPLCEKLK